LRAVRSLRPEFRVFVPNAQFLENEMRFVADLSWTFCGLSFRYTGALGVQLCEVVRYCRQPETANWEPGSSNPETRKQRLRIYNR